MDISIIIVNYKTVPLIMDCIKSIKEHTKGIDYEIIVVDNHSDDDFQSIIQSMYPDVVCIPLKENIGFGRANNEGFKVAKGRNLFCLNPDTILLNNAIKILSDYLDEHPNVGACGGNLYDENFNPTLSYRRFRPSIFWEFNELFWLIPERMMYRFNRFFNNTGKPLKVGYITGADLMIKRDVLNLIEGFSSEFFMYYEETDLCNRIVNENFEIHSVPKAEIQHLEGKSFKNEEFVVNRNKLNFSENGRKIYYDRNFSKFYHKIANLIYYLFLYSRLIILKLKGNARWNAFKVRIEINKDIN